MGYYDNQNKKIGKGEKPLYMKQTVITEHGEILPKEYKELYYYNVIQDIKQIENGIIKPVRIIEITGSKPKQSRLFD